MVGKYKVITLCGSTRFKDEFMEAQKRLTLEGNIVISVGLFGHAGDNEVWENMDEGTLTATKEMLDDMHKRKIDMADEIYVINVGGYIGSSTRSEIEYAIDSGKKVNYLEPTSGTVKEERRSFSKIEIYEALTLLQDRKSDLIKYHDLQKQFLAVNVAENKSFQKTFTVFYRLRRDDEWRHYYFSLFEEYKKRKDVPSFGEIQLRLFQHCGQVESSFSSKMLATLDPNMPIWDSYILKNLGLKLKGRTKEERFSLAVVLYDSICNWYTDFLKTDEAKEMLELFNEAFPEFNHFTPVKKIDFILWALR